MEALRTLYDILINEGCYESFMRHTSEANNYFQEEPINKAFTWDETAENWDYWNAINEIVGNLILPHGYRGRDLVEDLRKFEAIPGLLLIEKVKTWKT